MMEGFERYSAEKQDTDETVIAGLNEIEGKYIDPISLNLPKDFSKDLLDTMNLEWSISKDLISGENYYIPSNAIYHPYVPENNVQSLFKGNTNGLASGNILEEAILHGILKLSKETHGVFLSLPIKIQNRLTLKALIVKILIRFLTNTMKMELTLS